MDQALIIRKADANDAALIAQLSRETFYDSFAKHNTAENMEKFMREQFAVHTLMDEVEQPQNIFLLAFLGKDIAGYVKLVEGEIRTGEENFDAIEIARIYTTTALNGKGIGSHLMQACIDLAIEIKKELIWLGVWEHNLAAIRFYKRWGFEIFGSHEFVLGDDHQNDWLMKRNLITQ